MDSKVTRFIFWIAFMTFLCASIPHVAWIFDQFERGSDAQMITLGSLQFDVWQGLSYLIALSIDALVMWLSFQLSVGKNKIDAGMTWTFILILSALSWYCNWLYSIAHSPASHIDIWSLPILGGLTTVGTLTPFIVSAFPVFSIGYTFMLSRLSKASMTPDELKQQLRARKELADIRKEFASDESRVASFLKRGIKDIADVGTVAKDALTQVRQGQVTPVLSAESNQGSSDPIALVTPVLSAESNQGPSDPIALVTSVLSAESTGTTEGVTHVQPTLIEESISDPIAVQTQRNTPSIEPSETSPIEQSKDSSNGSTSRVYVPIEEAVEMLQYDLQYVKSLRTKGTLRTSGKNPDLITIASINAVLSKKHKATMKLPKVGSTPRDRDTGEMEIQPSLLQSDIADTSEETAEYDHSLAMSH